MNDAWTTDPILRAYRYIATLILDYYSCYNQKPFVPLAQRGRHLNSEQ